MHRGWQVLSAQVIAGVGIVVALVFAVDLEDVRKVFTDADYAWVLLALPFFLAANLIGATRSRLAVRRMGEVPLTPLFETYLVAFMVNSLVPLRIGDILRIQILSRRYELPAPGVTSSIFITETLFDGAAYTLMFLWTLAVFGVPGVLLSLAWTLSALILAGVLIAAVFARLELEDGWVDRGPVRWLPERLRNVVGRLFPEILEGLALLADWQPAVRAFALTLAGWMVQAAMYWTFGRAFGLDMSLADAILVMMAASFIVSAHFIPTSIGIYEGTITGLLVILGLSSGEALAYSVGTHVLMIFFGVVCGVVGMWRLRLGLHDLVVMGRKGVEETEGMLALTEPSDQATPVGSGPQP